MVNIIRTLVVNSRVNYSFIRRITCITVTTAVTAAKRPFLVNVQTFQAGCSFFFVFFFPFVFAGVANIVLHLLYGFRGFRGHGPGENVEEIAATD